MIEKHIDNFEIEDIQSLLDWEIMEGKKIDYKESLFLNSDKEKGEFLADITSFANTEWWDLIIWIKEKKWLPIEICWFHNEDFDKLVQAIENLSRNCVSPRISIDCKIVRNENTSVLIIRVKKCWNSPCRVTFTPYSKTKDQFYARNSSGKYPLDVNELKSAFLLSSTIFDKTKEFRINRITEIEMDRTPIPIKSWAKIILHIMPLQSFEISPKRISLQDLQIPLKPLYCSWWGHRINLDWFVTMWWEKDNHNTYTQLYHSWIIEAVDQWMLSYSKKIPSVRYEKEIIDGLERYLWLLEEHGIDVPIMVALTFIGMEWYTLETKYNRFAREERSIDRNVLLLPEFVIEEKQSIEMILRPMFDLVWNACGYKMSHNFNEQWEWIHKQ